MASPDQCEEPDQDQDGIPDDSDNCPGDQLDLDGDGIVMPVMTNKILC